KRVEEVRSVSHQQRTGHAGPLGPLRERARGEHSAHQLPRVEPAGQSREALELGEQPGAIVRPTGPHRPERYHQRDRRHPLAHGPEPDVPRVADVQLADPIHAGDVRDVRGERDPARRGRSQQPEPPRDHGPQAVGPHHNPRPPRLPFPVPPPLVPQRPPPPPRPRGGLSPTYPPPPRPPHAPPAPT